MSGVLPGAARAVSADDRRSPVNLFALSFLWFPINMFWTAMLQYLLPVRVQEMVGDTHKGEYLGYISLIGAVATTVIQLVVAPLSDASGSRWGRRHPFVFWGIVLNTAAVTGFALASNFPALLIAFFGIQLFLNIANGPYQALLPDNVEPKRHGVASTYMGMALLIGQLLGAVVLLARHALGNVGILGVITALLLLGAFITIKMVPDGPAPPDERKPFGDAMRTLLNLQLGQYPNFVNLLWSRFFINLSYATVGSFLLYYLQDAIGLGNDGAGKLQPFVILTATVAGLIGTLIGGAALARFTKKQVVYGACALLVAASIVFVFTKSSALVLVLAFLFGAGWGAFQAVDWALAISLLPPGGAARYMAVWHVCMTVPQIIALLFGKVADTLNIQYGPTMGSGIGWRAAMLSTVFYIAIGALILRRVNEPIADRETSAR